MAAYNHIPAMLDEVIEHLAPTAGNYIDCTLGGGGYSLAILKKIGDKGKILSIDLDKMAINNFQKIIAEKKIRNIILANDNFKNIRQIAEDNFGEDYKFNGIVLDLGLSNAQLEDGSRGFSFKLDAPLNMNFGAVDRERSVENVVNNFTKEKIREILLKYGEEKFANRIAGKIVEARIQAPIKTGLRLAEIIASAVSWGKSKIHPATKSFQAFRIYANDELGNLEKVLVDAVGLLAPGGRIAVVSYHSLEDRIVKKSFKNESLECVCPPAFPVCRCDKKAEVKIITKKPILPTAAEIEKNPKSRSAKLRVAEKT